MVETDERVKIEKRKVVNNSKNAFFGVLVVPILTLPNRVAAPKTIVRLAILLPTAFPMAKPGSELLSAAKVTVSSGKFVPRATIIIEINSGENFHLAENSLVIFKKIWAETSITVSPAPKLKIAGIII